ncbi:MAG: ribonuclease P protein component [Candidatus Sungbacteria bacterium RIFCSPLOWO2_02_FULL_54_10]|uniref:Ribonuclease P protein component n=1 Tax=Candidatus Sungbacteria bacterium RIFCSPHIGHO2_02_FULL_53_17 TaxID=1802275 RepID=A0A1G2KUN4_9BACT|nr:MAG: ribonuclease P protein component [Candidatus Sungbacteria bacterium RIFCSPHIGHO2_02_FULL_53_17]OHA13057.1 MAG: ribonuclease P protein component [Candidatus Sungbacteria bacterium RIFCSPLOWO2_02_FULL_54_10]
MKSSGRLGRGADLDLVLQRGRRLSHPLFSVAWRANGTKGQRFALIVPRTVDKRATVRNRLRRRMREFMRVHAGALAPPRDIAITCRREAAAATRKAFYEALEELIARLGKQ